MSRKLVQISTVKTGSNHSSHDFAVTVVGLDNEGGVWATTSYNARNDETSWHDWQRLPDLPEEFFELPEPIIG